MGSDGREETQSYQMVKAIAWIEVWILFPGSWLETRNEVVDRKR